MTLELRHSTGVYPEVIEASYSSDSFEMKLSVLLINLLLFSSVAVFHALNIVDVTTFGAVGDGKTGDF